MSDAKYIESKIDNNIYCKTNGQFTRHLRIHNLTHQTYYEQYITNYSPKCHCGNSLTFYAKNETYANSCGNPTCVGITISAVKQNWTNDEKAQDSINKKYAASLKTVVQKEEQQKKAKQTYMRRYGVEWATSSEQRQKPELQKKKNMETKHIIITCKLVNHGRIKRSHQ